MILRQNPFLDALATVLAARKPSSRSFPARRRLQVLRANTVRHRFGMASRAAALSMLMAAGSTVVQAANVTHVYSSTTATNWSTAAFTNGVPINNPGDVASATANTTATVTLDIAVTIGGITNSSGSAHTFNIVDDSNHFAFTLDDTGRTTNNNLGDLNSFLYATASGPLTVGTNIILSNTDADFATFNANFGGLTVGVAGVNTINAAAAQTRTLNLFSNDTASSHVFNINSDLGTSGGTLNIVNRGTGSKIVNLNGNLGANVASLTQNSTTSALAPFAANTNYTGTTNIISGLIGAGANTNLGSVVIGGAGTSGELLTNAFTVTVTGLATAAGSTLASQSVQGTGGLIYTTGATEFDGIITGTGLKLTVNSGALTLNGAGNSYTGLTTLNGGTLNINSTFALGGAVYAGTTFNGGTLQYNSTLLNTSTDITQNTAATPVAKPVTLTGAATIDTNGNNVSYANTFGAGGAGSFTKAGAGTLTFAGNTTYTGATTVSGGTLKLGLATSTNNLASSPRITVGNNATLDVTSLSGGAIALSGGQILGGSGTVAGGVTVGSGRVAPGAAGVGNIGNLTVSSLTLASGSQLDFDIASPGSLDQITVANANGLIINGGQLNINGATGTFTASGIYNLISYSGIVGGTGVSALSVNGANKDVGDTYTFGLSGSMVMLTVAGSGAVADFYTPNADSLYSNPANWSAGTPPNAVGAFAAFGGSGSAALTANRTITVDGAYTVGTISLNSANAFGYTLANGGAGTGLTLNNGTSGAFISDTAGSHTISAPLTLTANGATATVTAAADTLTVSGVVSSDATGDVGLTKAGNDTLVLTGVNTYFGGTSLSGGTLQINSASSLGDTSGALTFNGGALQLLADVTTARNYQVNGGDAIIDTNGHTLTLGGTVTPVGAATGGLVKNGLGTLALSGTNTFTGMTTVHAGTLSIAGDASLGAAPGAAATNLTIDPGAGNTATVLATGAFTLNANRGIVLNSGTASFNTNGNNVTIGGAISGNGAFQKDGAGILTLNATTSQAGNTVINAGTLLLANNVGLSGSVTIANGATFQAPASGTGNNITVSGLNANATIIASGVSNGYGGTFTGTADQTLTIGGTNQISIGASTKQFQTFLGTVEVPVGGAIRFSSTGLNNGGDNTTFDVNGFITTRNNGAVALGALTGSGTVTSGPSGVNNSTVVYTVGAKGINSDFSGVITNADTANGKLTALVKTGAGTQTLSGANTYSGATTISAGTLQIGNGGAAGSFGAGAVVNNATLAYNRSDVYSVGNNFSGTGTLVFLGAGTKTFTGEVDEGTINTRSGTLIMDPAIGSGLAFNSLNSSIAPNAGDNAAVTVQNSGSYNVNSANLIVGGQGVGILNINGPTAAGNGAAGGTVTLVGGLTIGNNATAAGTVNLNTGGTLTTPSIITGGGNSTLNLNGGTVVVAAGGTGPFITGLTAVNVQAGGAIINDGGNTVTIAQALLHDPALGAAADGGLVKAAGGAGILTLAAANTYNGGTTINAGTLAVSVNGGLGAGNVTLAAGVTLSLATGVTFAHNNTMTTALTLADATGVINLAAAAGTVQDVVGSLTIGTTTYAPGFYGSSTSGALPAFQLPEFTGSGLLDVGIPVPEPSTDAMLIIGLGGLGLLMARGKRVA